MGKRNLFDDLMEGFDALAAERSGRLTLKQSVIENRAASKSRTAATKLRPQIAVLGMETNAQDNNSCSTAKK